jgi:hypothetical protein
MCCGCHWGLTRTGNSVHGFGAEPHNASIERTQQVLKFCRFWKKEPIFTEPGATAAESQKGLRELVKEGNDIINSLSHVNNQHGKISPAEGRTRRANFTEPQTKAAMSG